MRRIGILIVPLVCLCFLAVVRPAAAQDSNYWIGTTGGDFTNTANWSKGTAPVSGDWVFFTNGVGQTIQFSTSVTNNPLRVYDTSVNYDLNGYYWQVNNGASWIGTNGGAAATVTFSSSSDTNVVGGNYARIGFNHPYAGYLMGNTTEVIVDDSLGFPVKLHWSCGLGSMYGPAPLTVSGPGTEFQIGFPNSGNGVWRPTLVTNQATFSWMVGNQHYVIRGYTTMVVNATMQNISTTAPFEIGNATPRAGLFFTDGSFWYDSNQSATPTTVGYASSGGGDLLLDNSTYVGQQMHIGRGATDGTVQILNGSSATFSNRLAVMPFSTKTNLLVLNSGTINLGGGATPGVLTNQGVMRLAGTINGIGDSAATVLNAAGASFEVGSSIGTLTLSNANLVLAAGSETLFEFSNTGLDQIIITDGSASVLGSNVFSLAAGSAPLGPYKWGLGIYDFVVGSSVTWNPQYDNLTSLLVNAGLVMNQDFSFGVVQLGDLQVLRLQFIPEPSTVLLLVGGGLVLWRVRRKQK